MGSLSSPIAALEDGKIAEGSDRIPVSRAPFGYKSDFHITPAYILEYVDKNLWRGLTVNSQEIKGSSGVLINDGGTLRTIETHGSGKLARTIAPEFTKPKLGEAQAVSVNGVKISGDGATLALEKGKALAVRASITLDGKDGASLKVNGSTVIQGRDGAIVNIGSGGDVAYVNDKLSDFAETTSKELRSVIRGATGDGDLVFAEEAQLKKPLLDDATLNRPKLKDARANSLTSDLVGVTHALSLAQDAKIEIGGAEIAEIKDGVLRLGSEQIPVYVHTGRDWASVTQIAERHKPTDVPLAAVEGLIRTLSVPGSSSDASVLAESKPDIKSHLKDYARRKYQSIRNHGVLIKDIEITCDAQTIADLSLFANMAKAEPKETFVIITPSGRQSLSAHEIIKIARYAAVWLQLVNTAMGKILTSIDAGKTTKVSEIEDADWPSRHHQFKPVEV